MVTASLSLPFIVGILALVFTLFPSSARATQALELMKLDIAAGFVAVFLIGFSADAIKNLLIPPRERKERRANDGGP